MSFWHLLATHHVHAHIQMKEGVRLLSGGGRFNLITSDGVEEGIRVLKRFQQVTEFSLLAAYSCFSSPLQDMVVSVSFCLLFSFTCLPHAALAGAPP